MAISIRCDECNNDADDKQICRDCYKTVEAERDDLKKEVADLEKKIDMLEDKLMELENAK